MTLTDWWQCPRCPYANLGGRCGKCGCQRPHAVRVTLSPAEVVGLVGPAATAAVYGAAARDADAGRFAADARLTGGVRP